MSYCGEMVDVWFSYVGCCDKMVSYCDSCLVTEVKWLVSGTPVWVTFV